MEANLDDMGLVQEARTSSLKDALVFGVASSLLVFGVQTHFFDDMGIETGDCVLFVSFLGRIKRR